MLNFYPGFSCLLFNYPDLLARISTLERENLKVEEKVEAAIERIFQSEIGKGNFRKDNCAF